MQAFTDSLRDRYVLERELGRGGMAVVYLARDMKHDRPVALKVLNPEAGISLGAERFQREIKLAASLQHPHVLPVHDSGETAGRLWFTMPFVRGESLRDRLRREGTLSIHDAIRITLEASQALAHAHRQRIVHRDVKPENILLTEDGSTLVADFGIARTLDAPREQELTATGAIVGTPKYMPPEQVAGGGDARVDQYALAETCFEMLAGHPPFNVDGLPYSMMRRVSDPIPSLRVIRPEAPVGVQLALERALAFDPESRFSSITEFARTLETGATAGTHAVPQAAGPAKRRTAMWAIGVVVLGLFGVLGAVMFNRRAEPSHKAAAATGETTVRRVVVLPFENQGDAGDAYFADGMADEVRGKLAAVEGLEVIARVSSSQYARTTKSPRQIADELGVNYILTGTVRWEGRPGGTSRVRVSPELVDARSGVTRWHQSFDTTLTDVFAVQADIAGKVADALDVAVGNAARQRLETKLTDNPEAYTHFLRGRELRAGDAAPDTVRRAIEEFQQAVTLDPAFAAAWSELGLASLEAWRGGGMQASDVKTAARAVEAAARLAPDAADTHLASGRYQDYGLGNPSAALAQYRAGLTIAPNHSDLLRHTGSVELKLGMLDEGVGRLEHLARLDPLSPDGAMALGTAYARLWRYADAGTALDRARALRPSSLPIGYMRARLAAARGDLAGVQRELQSLEASAGRRRVMAYLALRENILFALDDEQQKVLLSLTPADLDGGKADWALALAETSWLRHDQPQARSYGQLAATAYEQHLESWGQAVDREQVIVLRAYSLAYAGRAGDAIAEAGRALALERQLGLRNAYLPFIFARINVLANRPDAALDQLEETLRRRDFFSREWLRIDSTFAPLRANPRFQRLVSSNGSAKE
jgi:eukaryotic-like serine/threonine-protein kinase